jgi:hypothetical protein
MPYERLLASMMRTSVRRAERRRRPGAAGKRRRIVLYGIDKGEVVRKIELARSKLNQRSIEADYGHVTVCATSNRGHSTLCQPHFVDSW